VEWTCEKCGSTTSAEGASALYARGWRTTGPKTSICLACWRQQLPAKRPQLGLTPSLSESARETREATKQMFQSARARRRDEPS